MPLRLIPNAEEFPAYLWVGDPGFSSRPSYAPILSGKVRKASASDDSPVAGQPRGRRATAMEPS